MRRYLLAAVTALAALTLAGAADAATLHVATTGADTGLCVDSPCLTAGYAYKRAAVIPEATTVEFAAGTYPRQAIVNTLSIPRASDAPITFRPEPSADVKLVYFEIDGPDHIVIRDFKMDGWMVGQATDVDIINVDVDNGKPIINSSTDVRMLGGDVGPQCAGSGPGATSAGGAMQIKALKLKGQPKDILIDGVRFHDFTRCAAPGEDVHLDCLHLFTVDGLVIRRTTFDHCSVYDILFAKDVSGSGYGPPTNVDIVNNRFLTMVPGSSGSLAVFGDNQKWSNILVRNNTFADKSIQAKSTTTVPTYTNVVFRNNVMRRFNRTNCGQVGVTWQGNLYESESTGSTAPVSCATQGELRLDEQGRPQDGSAAINANGQVESAADDFDGVPRPQGPAPDAGAYERVEACPPSSGEPSQSAAARVPGEDGGPSWLLLAAVGLGALLAGAIGGAAHARRRG